MALPVASPRCSCMGQQIVVDVLAACRQGRVAVIAACQQWCRGIMRHRTQAHRLDNTLMLRYRGSGPAAAFAGRLYDNSKEGCIAPLHARRDGAPANSGQRLCQW